MSKTINTIFTGLIIGCVSVGLGILLISMMLGGRKQPDTVVEAAPGWTVTDDLTPRSRNISVFVLSDPHGKKFLLVKGGSGGISTTPYEAGK
jgi:hypothetical protein